jgi:hypothetical protein
VQQVGVEENSGQDTGAEKDWIEGKKSVFDMLKTGF